MKRFTDWMERSFVPIAAKIGAQKHLVAIRDSFIATMPITMAGSIAVLLNALLRDIPG
ncbi:MAG: PTS sugar transporter subunit IIC, partial [Erysipelothrix sp.]|nr:PTS sugar transporter subunit IIC [Erysipelothrix sp.]